MQLLICIFTAMCLLLWKLIRNKKGTDTSNPFLFKTLPVLVDTHFYYRKNLIAILLHAFWESLTPLFSLLSVQNKGWEGSNDKVPSIRESFLSAITKLGESLKKMLFFKLLYLESRFLAVAYLRVLRKLNVDPISGILAARVRVSQNPSRKRFSCPK